jgi:5-methylcytosine-specific restriction endonuclease McrA
MSDTDFDAYWKAAADRRAARKLKHQQEMAGRRKKKTRKAKAARTVTRHEANRWNGTYSEYLRSDRWAAKRSAALKHHGHRCGICGSVRSLEVHHLTYKRLGREKMKDLQVLCCDCHRIRHEDKPGVVTTDFLSEQFRAIIAN